MASNSQTFEPFDHRLANSSNFFAQRDTEHQLHGLFSALNLGTGIPQQPSLRPTVPATGPSEDIELDDIRSVEKKLTTKQLRKKREAEKAASNQNNTKKANASHKINKQKRAKIRCARRKSQKDRLDEINCNPQLVEQRLEALKRLHACAQDLHNATENKIELKQALRNLTETLASHTEKNADELYAELCQSNNQKSAEVLIEGKSKGLKTPDASFERFIKDFEKSVPLTASETKSKTITQQQRQERRKEVKASLIQPKFKLLAPSREQKIKNFQNWKKARPLILDLCSAVERRLDIAIAQSYAAARVPVKNLAEGLERGYEEVLSEIIPSFTRERIAQFEEPFIALEQAGKPALPDISTLAFNDGLDQSMAT